MNETKARPNLEIAQMNLIMSCILERAPAKCQHTYKKYIALVTFQCSLYFESYFWKNLNISKLKKKLNIANEINMNKKKQKKNHTHAMRGDQNECFIEKSDHTE